MTIKTESNVKKDLNSTLTITEKKNLFNYFPNGVICLDLETTGLSPIVDTIIEIAAIKYTPEDIEVFQTLVNPLIEIPPHTTAIHNITDEMVKDAPLLKPSLIGLKEFCGDLPIIAHNAKFDAGFIVMGFKKHNLELGPNKIYCSCKFSRYANPSVPNHKLSTLVSYFGIKLENHHRATDDALASLKLFIKSIVNIKTHEELETNGLIFNLNDFQMLQSEEIPDKLKDLEKLVKEAAVIEIKYSGGNHKNQFRPVKLTSLLNTPDGNILYAKCLWSDIQKSFKLKKIVDFRKPLASDIQKWLKK